VATADELDDLLAPLQLLYPWPVEEARAWWVLNRPEAKP
jgi:hypothetical protein